jgi:glycine/D-amino acid oxidase-like deaminating enzyme
VRRVRQLLPSIGAVEPEAVRIAVRPIPGHQLSAIGPMPRMSGYYIVVTHSGVTMSPFVSAAVTDEIVNARQKGISSPIPGLRVSSTDLETHHASGARRRSE